MGLLDLSWMWSLLGWLGLFRHSGRVLLLGLDNAGKTTLLHMLRDDHVATHPPTQRATKEEIQLFNTMLECYDLGGHEEARDIWREYYISANAIIFVVDASEPGRFSEASRELNSILTNEALRAVPIVVLGNKVDRAQAVSEKTFRERMGLVQTTGKSGRALLRPIEVFMCSVTGRFGYQPALQWLTDNM